MANSTLLPDGNKLCWGVVQQAENAKDPGPAPHVRQFGLHLPKFKATPVVVCTLVSSHQPGAVGDGGVGFVIYDYAFDDKSFPNETVCNIAAVSNTGQAVTVPAPDSTRKHSVIECHFHAIGEPADANP